MTLLIFQTLTKSKNKLPKKHSPLLSSKEGIKGWISPEFSIIIPNYNGSQFLDDCLYSLYQAIKQCSGNFEIIIVDNGSQDNSLKITKNFFDQYRSSKMSAGIYRLNSNTGFANAVNFGINKSKYKYIVLCNNDLMLEKDWFQLISGAIKNNQDPKVTTFFGTVLTKDGTKFESQGLKFSIKGKAENISNGKPFHKSTIHHLPSIKLAWGTSAALVVYQKDIIQKIGLFDSDFFAYQEDVDIALRLNKLKYKTLYIPKAICYHLGGGTSDKMGTIRSYLSFRNWFLIIIKNYSFNDIKSNFLPIIIERLKNFSYLTKSIYQTRHLLSLAIIPITAIKVTLELLFLTPKMLNKRFQFQKLVKSIKL